MRPEIVAREGAGRAWAKAEARPVTESVESTAMHRYLDGRVALQRMDGVAVIGYSLAVR